jgi:hypothetical protein
MRRHEPEELRWCGFVPGGYLTRVVTSGQCTASCGTIIGEGLP